MTIGVIGGYGAVGRHVVGLLGRWDLGPLRVGGRDADRTARLAAELGTATGHPVQATAVDATDRASLAAFVDGCGVVVCAAPSVAASAPVAAAVAAAGAALVDAGDPALALVDAGDPALAPPSRAQPVVLAAGGLPGMSGLLPRYVAARSGGRVQTLTAYYAVLDEFTEAAAVDYLDGVLDAGTSGASGWVDGHPQRGTAVRRMGVRMPVLDRALTLLPYLDAEGESVARAVRAHRATFFAALPQRLAAVLDGARTQDRATAVARLRRAAALETAGRAADAAFFVVADDGSGPVTTVLRAPGISVLTGATAAAAVRAVVGGRVAAGTHRAAEVLDPVDTLDALTAADVLRVSVFDGDLTTMAAVVDGVL